MGLRFLSLVPKYDTEYNTYDYCHEEPNGIILRIPPVRQMLLPETGFALSKK